MGEIFSLLEMLGTVAFALSGAMVAIERDADIFGVVFLGLTTAIGGGILRDTMLGKVPPTIFSNRAALLLAIFFSLLVFAVAYLARDTYERHKREVDAVNNLADTLGLGAFTVTGVRMGLAAGYGDRVFFVLFLGLVTGIGGGALRDVMTGSVPFVLKKRVYALASLGGAALYWGLFRLGVPDTVNGFVAVLAVFTVRLLATVFRWNLPRVRPAGETPSRDAASPAERVSSPKTPSVDAVPTKIPPQKAPAETVHPPRDAQK